MSVLIYEKTESPNTIMILWLVGALGLTVGLFEPTLLGVAIVLSSIVCALLVSRSSAVLVGVPLFVALNSEFLHTYFNLGSLGIPWKILLILLVALYFVDFVLNKKRFPRFIISPLFFAAWGSYLLWGSVSTHTFRPSLYIFLFFLFFLCIVSEMFTSESSENGEKFIRFFVFSVLFMALVGYVEVFLQRTFFLSGWATEERFRYGIMRIGSTTGDANFFCSYLIPTVFIINVSSVKRVFSAPVVRALTFIFSILVVLTFSRTGILIFVFMFFVLCLTWQKSAKLLLATILPAILAFGIIYILPTILDVDVNSNAARIYVNNLAYNVFLNHPLTGIGLGNFTEISAQYTFSVVGALETMNTYTLLLTSGGILNLIFFLVYIGTIIKKSKSLSNRDRILFLLGIGSYCAFIYTIDSFYIYYTWLFPSLLCALITAHREEV